MGLRPPHEAGQRAAERLLVELSRAIRAWQVLRRGVATVGREGGVGPGTAEPLRYLEVALEAGEVQWCLSPVVGRVEGGIRAVQPLSDGEVAPVAGEVQRLLSITTLHPHARAVRHRCLRCRQIARPHGFEQPGVEQPHPPC